MFDDDDDDDDDDNFAPEEQLELERIWQAVFELEKTLPISAAQKPKKICKKNLKCSFNLCVRINACGMHFLHAVRSTHTGVS
jgi:hypothetical protein